VRALWSLPRAAPALLRHVVAYAELAALDFTRAQREVGSIFIAAAIAAVCGIFCLSFACLAVIAYFWDTPYRVVSIGCLAGGFLLVAVIMLLYSQRLTRARTPFLSDLRHEWQQDRVILEHAVSSSDEE
jgi:uncharacterized membrane protein YqjE